MYTSLFPGELWLALQKDVTAACQQSEDPTPSQSRGMQLQCRVSEQSHSPHLPVGEDLHEAATLVLDNPIANYTM